MDRFILREVLACSGALTADSTQAETSGSLAQDRYCARGTGGGAKKRRGNGDEQRQV